MTQAEVNSGSVTKEASIRGLAVNAAEVNATMKTVVDLPRISTIYLGNTPAKNVSEVHRVCCYTVGFPALFMASELERSGSRIGIKWGNSLATKGG